MSDDKTPTEKLVEYTDIYAAGRAPGANQNHKNDELEVVFGYKRDLTQIEFESVISKLKLKKFLLMKKFQKEDQKLLLQKKQK